MKTNYKFIHFQQHKLAPDDWACLNNKSRDVLGFVTYYKPWRQWVFVPFSKGKIMLNGGCMVDIIDIIDFMKQLRNPE